MAGAQPSARLAELGITLPAVAAPVAAYVPAKQVGSQVWTSGQLPFVDGALGITGKVGASVTPEQAKAQARFAAAIVLLGGGDAGMPHRVLYRDEILAIIEHGGGKSSP